VVTGAALQLALWDVVHDGGDGLDMGLMRSTASIPNDILTQAAAYITASAGQSSSNAVVWESVLGKTEGQQMIGQVPEPGTIGLLASGLALLGWKARRRS
jgi:PEP-CTERM motif